MPRDDLFAAAMESLPVGVLVVSPEGAIVFVNREIERQLGYSRDELIGQSVDILLPDAARPGHAQLRAQFMRSPVADRGSSCSSTTLPK